MIKLKNELKNVKALIVEDFENGNDPKVIYDKTQFEDIIKSNKPGTITKVFYPTNKFRKKSVYLIQEDFKNGVEINKEYCKLRIVNIISELSDIPFDLTKKKDKKELEDLINDADEPYNKVFQILVHFATEEINLEIAAMNETIDINKKLDKKEK